ncbi:dioxygenase family protein [Salininema proteolyticum]|uniref:3,4-dioxygenase subunit beta n=1 Tax=Salininema proteolyticum TaxID=1607685 RepID=A0ABV8U1X2_9ACTN
MTDRDTPAYEGRAYHRPDENLFDQGLSFGLKTLVSRRRMLGLAGAGAVAAAGLAVHGTGAAASPSASPPGTRVPEEIPEEMAGPYPGDGSNGPDILERSGVVRSDVRSSVQGGGVARGVPMTIEMTVYDMAAGNARFEGAAVYIWMCDKDGGYSMYTRGLEHETYLRGVQIADADGTVAFTAVFPGCYPGRWPHVHFEVFPDAASIVDVDNVIATSQMALPEDVCRTVYRQPGYERSAWTFPYVSLETDMVFRDDGAAHQMAAVNGDPYGGYAATLPVGVDTGTPPGHPG